MTIATQAIAEAAAFNRHGCHVDSLAFHAISIGFHGAAQINLDVARELLDAGEPETAQLYINRAQWHLDASA